TYIAVVILNFLGSFLFLLLKIPKLAKKNIYDPNKRSNKQLVSTPRIAVAMICAMVSYAMMNLVMTSTPLAVVGCGYSPSDAANVVSAHVIAMFLPSFFTGHLITRYGEELIVGIGLFFLALAGIVALSGVNLENFFLALVFIGLGWNFGFIGATTMLTNSHSEAERGRIQGMNDLFVFGGVTVASFSSGGLMNCTGGNHLTGWTSVNLAIFPMLLIAAATLVWLMKNKTPNYINS
ncbi:MFS transporter, partial [Paracoccaceae bacterium]|nr:MFS transporter [Paracoccaceae bacterium]